MQQVGILIIAHAPMASALQKVAEHVYPECAKSVAYLDITPNQPKAYWLEQAEKLINTHNADNWLVLTDVFGATPSNIAQSLFQAFEGFSVRMVAGVNVPMLWRVLCYEHEPLDNLFERALSGGAQGVMPVSPSAPDQQQKRSNFHDFNHSQNQQ